jgi:hypothetical protein
LSELGPDVRRFGDADALCLRVGYPGTGGERGPLRKPGGWLQRALRPDVKEASPVPARFAGAIRGGKGARADARSRGERLMLRATVSITRTGAPYAGGRD